MSLILQTVKPAKVSDTAPVTDLIFRGNSKQRTPRRSSSVFEQWKAELVDEGWPEQSLHELKSWDDFCRKASPAEVLKHLTDMVDPQLIPHYLGPAVSSWFQTDADSWDRMTLLVIPRKTRKILARMIRSSVRLNSVWREWCLGLSIWKEDAEKGIG